MPIFPCRRFIGNTSARAYASGNPYNDSNVMKPSSREEFLHSRKKERVKTTRAPLRGATHTVHRHARREHTQTPATSHFVKYMRELRHPAHKSRPVHGSNCQLIPLMHAHNRWGSAINETKVRRESSTGTEGFITASPHQHVNRSALSKEKAVPWSACRVQRTTLRLIV